MKSIIFVALALAAVAIAGPVDPKVPEILRSKFELQPEGGYDFGFESNDGISRQETGEVKVVPDEENKPQKVVTVRGSYTYINTDGTSETVNYFADETGFHAEGPSIPKPARR